MVALSKQIGGGHYKDLVIQPVEYIHKNEIPFIEGSVIKYVTRWRSKGGIQDLQKAVHFIEMLIEMEKENGHTS
jgi:UDP-3-O-acyl-N-acetylglucosamine deacetylase